MTKKYQTLNEEIKRIKTLFNFDYSYSDLIKEAEETSNQSFDFSESYPDNVAFPIVANASISSVNDVLNTGVLNPKFIDFVNRLKTKLTNGVKVTSLKINTGASPEKATTTPPAGFDQSIVNYSFKDDGGKQNATAFNTQIKVTVDNSRLAFNRANFMSWILKSLIPELANVKIEVSSDLKEKSVNIQIPSDVMVNFETHPEISKEYIKPTKFYTPSFEKPSVVAACNAQSKATGNAGNAPNYIADRIKFDVPENYGGNITFKYNSYGIPDRFQVIQLKDGKTTILKDTNFVSTSDGDTFNIYQKELSSLFKTSLSKGGEGEFTFKSEPGSQYFVDVIAPFGGTAWGASLSCQSKLTPIKWQFAWGDLKMNENTEYTFYTDTKGNYYTENPDGNLKIYSKGKFKLSANGPVLYNGVIYDYTKGGTPKETKVVNGKA